MKHRGLKFLSLLLTLALLVGLMPGMSLTAYAASETTVTYDLSVDGKSINKDGVTCTSSFDYYNNNTEGGTFSTSSGTFTRIVVNANGVNSIGVDSDNNPIAGWSSNGSSATWTGNSSSVQFGTILGHLGNVTITFTIAPTHTHSFTYTADGATITATCNGEGTCDITEGLTLTISAPTGNLVYDGTTTYPATLSTGYNTTAFPGTYSISYTKDGSAYSGVPKDAGTYTASVTAGTGDGAKTASVSYTIQSNTFTVTYIANNGTNEKVVEDNRAAGDYIIQAYDKNFTVPDGKVFDYWKGSDDGKYKDEQTIQLTGDLILTAQWKDEEKKDGGEKKTSGGGSGFDLVFNIPGEDNSWGYGGGYAPQQAYRVSLAPMQGGSAALGLTTGDSGTQMNVYPSTTVYVFPNAEQGYTLDKIVWSLIDGSASYDITEAKNFVMPAMDVVVYVTFKPVG